jgi:hypothetical protein
LPVDQAGGGDKGAGCMASFLATVSASARCVDDAANADDCNAVRNEAVLVAGACNGPTTADVLARHGSIHTQAVASAGSAGALGAIFKLLGSFALGGGNAGGLGSFASILGGKGGGLGGFTGLLGGLLKGGGGLLGGGKTPASGLGSLAGLGNGVFDQGVFDGESFDVSDFGNSDLFMDDLGDVTGDSLF